MSTAEERARARERAADGIATREDVVISRPLWWATPVSNLGKAERKRRQRAQARSVS